MKKFLLGLFAVATLGVVSCEKDEIAALDARADQIEAQAAADRAASNAADDALAASIAALESALASAVEMLEAADDALEALLNSTAADIRAELQAAVDSLSASIASNLSLINSNFTALQAAIDAEEAARAAGDNALAANLAQEIADRREADAVLLNGINENAASLVSLAGAVEAHVDTLNIRIDGNLASINTNINDINLNFLDIQGNVADIRANNLASIASDAGLQTSLDTASATLGRTRSALDALTTRVANVELFGGQIAQLRLDLVALDGATHTSTETTSAIADAIAMLETSLQAYADNNDDDTIFDPAALQAEIDAAELLIAALRTELDAAVRQINWQNGLIAGLILDVQGLQAGSISVQVSGTTLTLTVSGTQMSYDINQSGGSDGSHGSNGAPGSNGADGADGVGISGASYDPATGILTINFTDSTSYSTGDLRGPAGPIGPAGNDGADGAQGPAGQDGADGATGPQGPQGPAGGDAADTGFVISDPVQTRGGDVFTNLRATGNALTTVFLVDGDTTEYTSIESARASIPFGGTRNITEVSTYNEIHDVSAIETLYVYVCDGDCDGDSVMGAQQWRESTPAQIGIDAGTVGTYSGTGSGYTSTAADPAASTDADGDGHFANVDPNDNDANIYPGSDSDDVLSQFGAWSNIAGSEAGGVPAAPVRGSLIRTEYLIGTTVYTSLADARASFNVGVNQDIITRMVYGTTVATSAATVQQEQTRVFTQNGELDSSYNGVAPSTRATQTIETSPASSAAGSNENVDSTDSYEGTNVVATAPSYSGWSDADGDGVYESTNARFVGITVGSITSSLAPGSTTQSIYNYVLAGPTILNPDPAVGFGAAQDGSTDPIDTANLNLDYLFTQVNATLTNLAY